MWFSCMSAFRPISKVLRNISCLCLNDMYSHCKHFHCWDWKRFSGIFLRVSGGEYSTKCRSVSNCTEDENMLLSPCMKKSLSAGCFLKSGLISSSCTVEFVYGVIFSRIHILYPDPGFHYSKLHTLMILVALAIFQTWIWVGVGIDKLLIDLGSRNFFNTKLHGLQAF
jgi:hypothetical protein